MMSVQAYISLFIDVSASIDLIVLIRQKIVQNAVIETDRQTLTLKKKLESYALKNGQDIVTITDGYQVQTEKEKKNRQQLVIKEK